MRTLRGRTIAGFVAVAMGISLFGIGPATGATVDLAETARYLRSSDGGRSVSPQQLDDIRQGVNLVNVEASDGTVHVTFSDQTKETVLGPAHVFYRRSVDSGRSYSPSVQIDDDSGDSSEADLVAEGETVLVTWEEGAPVQDALEDIYYNRSTNDGVDFEGSVNFTDTEDIQEHDADPEADGDLLAVAYEGNDDDPDSEATEELDVFVRVSTDGGGEFAEPINLTDTGLDGDDSEIRDDEPATGVGGDDIVVVYRQRAADSVNEEDPGQVMWVHSADQGEDGTWSAPAQLPGTPGTSSPGIYMNGEDVHVVACHEDDPFDPADEENFQLLYWHSGNGGASFDDPMVLHQDDESCNKPVIDGAGDDLHLVFEQDVAGRGDILSTRSHDGGDNWSAARNRSANPLSSRDPAVAVDPDNHDDVHLAWTDSSDFLLALRYGQELPVDDGDDQRFANEDVIRYAGGTYEMVLDGSDVALRNFRIDALAEIPGEDPDALPRFVISFTEPGTVPGVGRVDDSDLVLFTPDQLGEHAEGTFSLFFDGSDIGLTQSDEDVDAVEIDGGNLYLSTTGSFKLHAALGDLQGKDEDIFACEDYTPGANSACAAASVRFDGSQAELTRSNEDIDAFALSIDGDAPGSEAFFSTEGDHAAGDARGNESDLFACTFPEFDNDLDAEPTPTNFDGDLSDCGSALSPLAGVFRAGTNGIEENITAIDVQNREVEVEEVEYPEAP